MLIKVQRVLRFELMMIGMVLSTALLPLQASTDPQTLIAQALVHLQNDQKPQALKLLEKAFDSATDPDTVKEAAVLLLQASPDGYSKRESILKYLTLRNRTHEDLWRWHKELGDRAFNRADFASAEESYLQAQASAPDPFVIKYKLAWTYWNQKRKNEALSTFIDLSLHAHTNPAPENLSLKDQMIRDMAKLWWEIGPLPAATLEKLIAGPEDFRATVFSEFISAFPQESSPPANYVQLFLQLKEYEPTKSVISEFATRDLFFKRAPCFLIAHVYTAEDFAPPRTLVSCAASADRPAPEALLRHFERLSSQADENLTRAHAQFLIDAQKSGAAAKVMMAWSGFDNATSNFLSICTDLSGGLTLDEFKELYSATAPEKFEKLLAAKKKSTSALLLRLQEVDPERWIEFEEVHWTQGKPSRELLLRKAAHLAKDFQTHRSKIEELVLHQLLSKPANAEEKAAAKAIRILEDRKGSAIEKVFGDKMMKDLTLWNRDLDQSVENYQKLSEDWQNLVGPIFKERLTMQVDSLLSQVDLVELPPESPEDIQSDFAAKKAEIKEQIKSKYSEFGALNP